MNIAPLSKSDRIRVLNDNFRSAFVGGQVVMTYPSAEGRLPESLHFAESDVILGAVRARSVHK